MPLLIAMPLLWSLAAFDGHAAINMALLTELALDIGLCESVGDMANTYTQIYIQVVFAVQGRQSLVRPERKEELQKYMTGIVSRQGQKLIAIHCMPDHTHVLIGLRPNIALSDLVGDIKTGSTNHNQRAAVGAGTVLVAGRLRRLFVFSLATQGGD
jgi:REP element-mobilizing transposase RayT